EPGSAKGIKSNTVGGYCYPIEHSRSVRAGGKPILRHGDTFWMNGPPADAAPKQPVSSSAAAIAGLMAAGESTTLRGAASAVASSIPKANPIVAAASALFYSGEVGKGSDRIPPEYQQSYSDDKIKGPNLGAVAKELGGGASGTPDGWGPEDEEKASAFKYVYNSIKDAPQYPKGFRSVINGTKKVNINNTNVLKELRKIESGKWQKVYKNGIDASGNRVSLHYFESQSGRVFNVKVKTNWSSF
ncbi:MAG: PAAR-like domain-containing protein, partial [Enterobacteriaceae bacterium]